MKNLSMFFTVVLTLSWSSPSWSKGVQSTTFQLIKAELWMGGIERPVATAEPAQQEVKPSRQLDYPEELTKPLERLSISLNN